MTDVDLWIRDCTEEGQGLLVTTVQLSTWQTEMWHYTANQRQQIAAAWNSIGSNITTVEGMRDAVATFTVKPVPIPTFYVGHVDTNIIVDVHERDNIAAILDARKKVPLYAGDYFWKTKHNKLVMVERKQFENGELIGALFSPRGGNKKALEAALTSQAKRMSECADIRILLIEMGYYKVDSWSGLVNLPLSNRKNLSGGKEPVWPYRWADIQKALMSLYDKWGIRPWLTYSREFTGEDLLDLRRYLDKDRHSSQSTVSTSVIIDNGINYPPEVQVLCQIADGIGPILAERAITHFGSVRAAANASEQDWLTIEGFGKVKAKAVSEAFSREYKAGV